MTRQLILVRRWKNSRSYFRQKLSHSLPVVPGSDIKKIVANVAGTGPACIQIRERFPTTQVYTNRVQFLRSLRSLRFLKLLMISIHSQSLSITISKNMNGTIFPQYDQRLHHSLRTQHQSIRKNVFAALWRLKNAIATDFFGEALPSWNVSMSKSKLIDCIWYKSIAKLSRCTNSKWGLTRDRDESLDVIFQIEALETYKNID